jgi:uncharacterized protein YecE (DUF72 family)
MTDDPSLGALRVGCSGWLYRHWRGDFYPAGLRQKDELGFYTARFDTAEINASFYRMPERRRRQAGANAHRTASSSPGKRGATSPM